jgi:hypothetical protein
MPRSGRLTVRPGPGEIETSTGGAGVAVGSAPADEP